MITSDYIIKLHSILISKSGGVDGLRDKNLLESTAYSPYQSFDGQEQYPSIEEKAAKYAFSFVKNHVFVDGNKRIGIMLMILFLEKNNIYLNTTDNDLVKLGLNLANGKYTYEDVLNWVQKHKQ